MEKFRIFKKLYGEEELTNDVGVEGGSIWALS